MQYDKIRKHASQLLAVTGFTSSQFEALLICFKYHWEEYYSQYIRISQKISPIEL